MGGVVGLVDILPTVCGILGIDIQSYVHGKDLKSRLSGRTAPKTRHLFTESLYATKFNASPLFGLVGNQWKYILSSKPELYDLKTDPGEMNNLVNDPEYQEILGELKSELEKYLDALPGKFDL